MTLTNVAIQAEDGKSWYIALTKGRCARIDEADLESVLQHCWHTTFLGKRPAAKRWRSKDGKQVPVLLHHEIMGAKPGQAVAARNGDLLDCRRKNLYFKESSPRLTINSPGA